MAEVTLAAKILKIKEASNGRASYGANLSTKGDIAEMEKTLHDYFASHTVDYLKNICPTGVKKTGLKKEELIKAIIASPEYPKIEGVVEKNDDSSSEDEAPQEEAAAVKKPAKAKKSAPIEAPHKVMSDKAILDKIQSIESEFIEIFRSHGKNGNIRACLYKAWVEMGAVIQDQ